VRITIEAECRRGLRIIEEIPDIALCKIEGYNGIGKTNAIKLLRLCTGEQPFENDEGSWRTFRSQLVRARVHVTGLREAEEIEWLLEPNRWPEDPEPPGDLLGTVSVSGRERHPRDVLEILKIYHVIAAETPASVLAGRAHVAHKQVSDWFTAPGRQRQDEIEDRLFEIQKAIADCLPSQLHQDLSVAPSAEPTPQFRVVVSGAAGNFTPEPALAEGADVRAGQLIGHVVTRQGAVEVTAHDSGVLTEWLAHHDDPVAPGQPLARIGGHLA